MKIRHKGLRVFAATGSTRGIPSPLAGKLLRILTALDRATRVEQLDNPAWRLHPLKGDVAGYWSIRATGNWRVVFRFEAHEAVDVDLVDYH